MSEHSVVWKGRCGPFTLRLAPDTFRPTTVSRLVADSMEVGEESVVIDIGCGSGLLSIIAAKLGANRVFGVDAAEQTVEVATANAEALGVADITAFFRGDVFDPVPPETKADLVIGDISGIPDEIADASGWFPSGLAGGPTGAELPMRMLDQARKFMRKGGRLLLPTGSLQDESSILDRANAVFGSLKKLTERAIPLPEALASHPAVRAMARKGTISISQRGSRSLWTARVWEATA